MPTITLDDVIAEQQRLAAMIEAFQATNTAAQIPLIANALRKRGLCVKADLTKTYRSPLK